jgi:hypothetical protein
MSDQIRTWTAGLDLTENQIVQFETLVDDLGLSVQDLISMMIAEVTKTIEIMQKHGLSSFGFHGNAENIKATTEIAVTALPINIRPTGFMWPTDKPFPWSAEECKAAVMGYEVRWPGEVKDFFEHLRGLWEMNDDYGFLLQR